MEDATISEIDQSSALFSANGLACRKGDDLLFANFSFEIRSSQVVWLRGRNGQGKTSLLRLIVGLSEPYSGTINWGILDGGEPQKHFGRCVYIGHKNALRNDLTVMESLQFLGALHGRQITHKALERALASFQLGHRLNAPVRTLSQGQRRRVTLARLALETAPALWVLDEPFDTLDSQGIAVVDSLIADHISRGGSVILTSHIPVALTPPATVQTLDLPEAIQT